MQRPPEPAYALEEATTWDPERDGRPRPAVQRTHEGPPPPQVTPPTGASVWRPVLIKQISGILGQILRAQFVFKSWKEIHHCETTLKVKS